MCVCLFAGAGVGEGGGGGARVWVRACMCACVYIYINIVISSRNKLGIINLFKHIALQIRHIIRIRCDHVFVP